MPEIKLASDILFHIGPFGITNAMLGSFLTTLIFLIFGLLGTRRWGIVPTRFQLGLEMIYDYIFAQLETAFGSKKLARRFFPVMMTLLLFLAVANQFSLIPLITNLLYGGEKIFRVPTTDLTQIFILSLLMVGSANVLAITASPLKYIGSFFRVKPFLEARSMGQFFNAFIEFFLGLLDIIGELAKVVSLSFRLFGNIFAGEVMVAVIAALSIFTLAIVPVPFVALSIFSGLIQAFVFVLLSTQYIAVSIRGFRQEQVEAAAQQVG